MEKKNPSNLDTKTFLSLLYMKHGDQDRTGKRAATNTTRFTINEHLTNRKQLICKLSITFHLIKIVRERAAINMT